MNLKKELYLTCNDYTVSNKKFDLLYNSELDMLETFPQPIGQDLAKYYESSAYISHTDSKKSLTDKLYQIVKSYALKSKLKLIDSFQTEEKNILDVGCGTGEFLLTCKKGGWNVIGVEPNLNARELAISKLNKNDSSIILSDINEITAQQFDVITLWHVLEHVPNLTKYISKLKSLLKPNGVLLIAVPNYKSFDAMYYKNYWAAFDVPRHLWHFSKTSIKKLFSKENLKVNKILPMKFDSFYVSLLSEKYKTSKSNMLKAFYIGFRSNLKAISTKEYSSLIYIIKNT
ncbi:class I SAM-dependent methyltransferase [Lutibacter flavus]|uniref:Methyltransferase domain-containing protein n=1 Tax=Lutibacter flavus TaxID=691689 RepID=A0A238WZT5_9FLAO|nr:class I SAM-dependent methyltransferase [Lutibacter flavus]SNR51943.1 Methyltransferase domain-containing protein [Lutibacter flavus]